MTRFNTFGISFGKSRDNKLAILIQTSEIRALENGFPLTAISNVPKFEKRFPRAMHNEGRVDGTAE